MKTEIIFVLCFALMLAALVAWLLGGKWDQNDDDGDDE
jgi:hypothetical protein